MLPRFTPNNSENLLQADTVIVSGYLVGRRIRFGVDRADAFHISIRQVRHAVLHTLWSLDLVVAILTRTILVVVIARA